MTGLLLFGVTVAGLFILYHMVVFQVINKKPKKSSVSFPAEEAANHCRRFSFSLSLACVGFTVAVMQLCSIFWFTHTLFNRPECLLPLKRPWLLPMERLVLPLLRPASPTHHQIRNTCAISFTVGEIFIKIRRMKLPLLASFERLRNSFGLESLWAGCSCLTGL